MTLGRLLDTFICKLKLKIRNDLNEEVPMRYFMVTAKCGHVGRDFYIPIDFPVRADSARGAATAARSLPRVKHHHKDAILSVVEISCIDYDEQCRVNSCDPYLLYHNIQEQRSEYDAVYSRIIEEARPERREKQIPEKAIYSGKERIRNARRYAKEQASAYAMLEAI